MFYEFLKDKIYDNVLCCDSRDIYFQSNPFHYKFKKDINFFLEDFVIKNCPYNSNWLLKCYGKKEYDKIKNEIILCSGTVIGKKEKMLEYFNLMNKHIEKYKYKKSFKYLITLRRDPEGRGCDQAHANYIVNNKLINDMSLNTNANGPIATVFYLKNFNFDKNFDLINSQHEPYSIVHQYDKKWDIFSGAVKKLKNKLNILD